VRLIHVLFTGGTISMQFDAAAGGNVPVLGGEALMDLAPAARASAQVRVENWARKPACHMTQADLFQLRARVREVSEDPAVDGIVITHGTDTLEETAYLLDRTLGLRVPVVVTGAMRTSDAPDWDGTRNLTDAIRVAVEPACRGRGVFVVFSGTIWNGMDAVKTHTVAIDAFFAPHGKAIGKVHESGIGLSPARPRPAPLSLSSFDSRIALVPMAVGDDGRALDAARAGHDGVVIEAFGSGNVPPGAMPALQQWLDDGKPVVLASRCPMGSVTPVYGFEGGGARTVALGVVPAGPRTASQARWELTIAHAAGVPYASGLSG
jgi:L-asparaginase